MRRWSSLAWKRALWLAAVAVFVVGAPRGAMAQEPAAAPPQADPLKFSTSRPMIVGWQVRADKTADFEEFWAGIRTLIVKSENAELKAFGDTLTKFYRVDQPPFELSGNQVVIYLFQLETPSTTHSYNPVTILYTYLGAGVEGSKVTRAEADALYEKFKASYLAVNPLWPLVKVG